MSFNSGTYLQKAVVWEFSSYDSHREPRVSLPQEFSVRHELNEAEIVTEQDTNQPATSEMWVESAVASGSIVWLGTLVDLPASPTNLFEVVGCSSVPDVKGRVWEYLLTLARYKHSLPTVTT